MQAGHFAVRPVAAGRANPCANGQWQSTASSPGRNNFLKFWFHPDSSLVHLVHCYRFMTWKETWEQIETEAIKSAHSQTGARMQGLNGLRSWILILVQYQSEPFGLPHRECPSLGWSTAANPDDETLHMKRQDNKCHNMNEYNECSFYHNVIRSCKVQLYLQLDLIKNLIKQPFEQDGEHSWSCPWPRQKHNETTWFVLTAATLFPRNIFWILQWVYSGITECSLKQPSTILNLSLLA